MSKLSTLLLGLISSLGLTQGWAADFPLARPDTQEACVNTPRLFAKSVFLANDSAVKKITSVQSATHGSVSLDASGGVLFTGAPGYLGLATFTYTVDGVTATNGTALVTIDVRPPAVVTWKPYTSACPGQPVEIKPISDRTGTTFLWDDGSTNQSRLVTPWTNTTYCVTATTPYGCSTTSCLLVKVKSAPAISINSPITCPGGPAVLTVTHDAGANASILWSNGATTPSITVSPTATTTYTVSVNAPGGCAGVSSTTVTVIPAPSVTVNSTNICPGNPATLTASAAPGVTFLWSNGATTPSITVWPAQTTNYWVTVKSASGCTATASGTIAIIPPPVVSVNSGSICPGGSFMLTANGSPGVTFLWSNGATTPSITVSPTQSTNYSVTVRSAAGCTATASGTVTVNPPPTVAVSSGAICAGDSITLTATASPGVTYLWSNGATTPTITVSPSQTTTYSLTVSKPNSGCAATASGIVTVSPMSCGPGALSFSGKDALRGAANVRTFTSTNGVVVKVTAFSRTTAGVWDPAYVGLHSPGLGVVDTSEDGSGLSYAMDNIGRDNFLLFEFSQPVVLSSATLGFVSTDSDVSIRIGNFVDPFNNHLILSDAVFATFGYAEENAGGASARMAMINPGGIVGNAVIIAASLTDKTQPDQIKVQALGFCKPVCFQPVTIGDRVWNDLNKNGLQDANEPGLPGVKLNLTGTSISGTPVARATYSAATGAYQFGALEPGAYFVSVDGSNFGSTGALIGFLPSSVLAGTDRALDSNPISSSTTPAALAGGASDLTIDFGFFQAPPLTPCLPSTFDFASSSQNTVRAGNLRAYSVNGVDVRISAYSRDRSSGAWEKAYVGAYADGLGITDTTENASDPSAYLVDNTGGRDNYLLFEFARPVVINRAYLSSVLGDSDLSAWIGSVAGAYITPQAVNDSYLSALRAEDNATSVTTARWASLNSVQWEGNVLLLAASVSDTSPEDKFTLRKLDVCAPAPMQAAASDCTTTLLNFAGNSASNGPAGNILNYTLNGVSVNVSAFSRSSSGAWSAAYAGAYATGLGVTDATEGPGANSENELDNIGSQNYLVFEFSQPVIIKRAYLAAVLGDSDATAWLGNALDPFINHLTLSDAILNSPGTRQDSDTTSPVPRWADLNIAEASANILIVAASIGDDMPNDRFTVQDLEFCASPAPPSPSPWIAKDINASKTGYSSYVSGVHTLKGGGAGIAGIADGFRYLYQSASGDCAIIAHVTTQQNTDLNAKAGVMIRETLTPDSRHASMFITPGNGAVFQWRSAPGNTAAATALPSLTAPYWLKLVRAGNTFTGYYSPNGATWTLLSWKTMTMTPAAYIGLAVSSHDDGAISAATFDNVTVVP